jgi:predicted O-methyltransferase YrrM
MTNTLLSRPVRTVLDRLHAAAAHDDDRPSPWTTEDGFATATAAERADGLREVYMPISAQAGELFYALVRSARPATVVEFGTSFGISTLYLAAALADNGSGRVVSTELSADKVAAARANLDEAGLADRVTIVPGDALTTLADLPGPIDLLLLDGWKDLYLPVLDLLEDRLTPGALVLADDAGFASVADYLAHVRRPDSGYVTVDFPVEDGVAISCWTGRG